MRYIHDIAHCKADTCERRKECYRWNAYQEATENIKQNNPEIFTLSVLLVENPSECKNFMFDDTYGESSI